MSHLPKTFEQFLQIFFQGFLLFTHEYAVIILIAIGFLIFNRKIFGKALFILLFTMILNTFLKSIWQIPLPRHVGAGYSFPSGHMQTAFALWGWLAWEFKNPYFTGFAVILLGGIAFGLIYFGYHVPYDILGAVCFGSITLIAYYYFLKIDFVQKHLPLIGLIFVYLTLPIIFLLRNNPGSIWIASGALTGFSIGWYCQDRYFQILTPTPQTLKDKIILILIALCGVIVIKLGCQFFLVNISKSIVAMLSTFLVGLWVSAGVERVSKPRLIKM